VIQYLDTTLSLLLTTELKLVLPNVPNIYFLTPDADFPGHVTMPALNLFLFSVQENRDLRTADSIQQRLPDGTVQMIPPPARVDCHYIVTAYANPPDAPLEEHWILGETLRVLLRYRTIPQKYITGPITVQGLPVRSVAGLPTSRDAGIDLWQALGQKPRACFHYVATVNMDLEITEQPQAVAPVLSVVIQGPPNE
jgi:hypothetical protein